METYVEKYHTFLVSAFVLMVTLTYLNRYEKVPKLPEEIDIPVVPCCTTLSVVNTSINGSKIIYKLTSHIDRIHTYLPSLLRVFVNSGGGEFIYTINNFFDIENDGIFLSFSIIHPYTGVCDVVIRCQDVIIHKNSRVLLNQVNSYPTGFSRIFNAELKVAQIHDACINQSTLYIFWIGQSRFNKVQLSRDRVYDVLSLPIATNDFLSSTKFYLFHGPTIFISASPRNVYETLVDLCIPLFLSVYQFKLTNTSFNVVLLNREGNLISDISPIHPTYLTAGESFCFSDGIFPSTLESIPLHVNSTVEKRLPVVFRHIKTIMMIRHEFYKEFRRLYVTNETDVKTIVLEPTLKKLYKFLSTIPGLKVYTIEDSFNMATLSKLMGSARLYIYNNPFYLVYSILMNPNNVFLDLGYYDGECEAISSNFIGFGNHTHYKLTETKKSCADPSDVYQNFTDSTDEEPGLSPELITGFLQRINILA